MADVRTLLAAERQSRRITHPHLSYSKSGMLICTVCNLNVKSEALWEGHLRSANHRKNAQVQAQAQATQESTVKGTKRKIEDVDEDEPQQERYDAEADALKKPKSRLESITAVVEEGGLETEAVSNEEELEGPEQAEQEQSMSISVPGSTANTTSEAAPTNGTMTAPAVDEDEWAAFEREVAPLTVAQPDYSSATISAAPVSTQQMGQQADEDKRRRLETEADDEKEEEERRLEEEFEVMEEIEERVRRMREKRDALRNAVKAGDDTGQEHSIPPPNAAVPAKIEEVANLNEDNDEEEEEDDDDDWYR